MSQFIIYIIKLLTLYFFIITAIEALTEIVVDAKVFFSVRNFFAKVIKEDEYNKLGFFRRRVCDIRAWIGKLLSCGYCFSVWVAAPFAFIAPGSITAIWWIDLIIKWMVLHRMSNMLHEGFMRWLKRAPWVLVFQKTVLNMTNDPIKPVNDIVEVPEEKDDRSPNRNA